MTKADQTRSRLLERAQHLFWSRGYSNVSLREIAGAAGVDVALISRYFGSKRGLFEATLETLPELDTAEITDADSLIELVVVLFATAERDGSVPSATTFILMNAFDPEVGEIVQSTYRERWQDRLEILLGSKQRAANFSAAMLGMSVAEKALHLDGIHDYRTEAYQRQLRDFLIAAIGSGEN